MEEGFDLKIYCGIVHGDVETKIDDKGRRVCLGDCWISRLHRISFEVPVITRVDLGSGFCEVVEK